MKTEETDNAVNAFEANQRPCSSAMSGDTQEGVWKYCTPHIASRGERPSESELSETARQLWEAKIRGVLVNLMPNDAARISSNTSIPLMDLYSMVYRVLHRLAELYKYTCGSTPDCPV